MGERINIYCDESCHLENDHQAFMVLGAISCPADAVKAASASLTQIRTDHNLPKRAEIKWGSVSPANLPFFQDVVQFFFKHSELTFRCVIAPKGGLTHSAFGQIHDEWYYKMYFYLLRNLVTRRDHTYRIFIDVKDTASGKRNKKLHDVLCNNQYDFAQKRVEGVQALPSHEVQLMQVADLFSGAVSYSARGLTSSKAKVALAAQIANSSGWSLQRSTWLSERKFNIFRWQPQVLE
jgi:Protein of unknown function (DUF3800)